MKNILKAIVVLVSATVLTNCGPKSKPTPKSVTKIQSSLIINGTPVLETDALAKSVVGMMMNYQYSPGNKFWIQACTGSVLNNKFILTAAHCVAHMTASDLAINFSLKSVLFEKQFDPKTRIVDIEKNFTIRKVKALMTHPKYDGSGNNDLALLLLDGEVPTGAVPVQLLPDSMIDLANNQTAFDQQKIDVVLMGFGLISENPQTDTEVLRTTTVPAIFDKHFVVTDQTNGTGGCNGDSGGPAFYTLSGVTYQVGVTHGPHAGSTTCHEQGEWVNPALNKAFLESAQIELLK